METQQNEQSQLISDLRERRFLKYLGYYVGLAFGVVQFITFAEERFGWSDSIGNKSIIFFIALLPSVILFTYNHGRPGRDAWTKFEKRFIPINIIATVLITLLSFNQSTPTNVSVTTPEGEEVERTVASKKETKKIMVLPLAAALPELLEKSLKLNLLTTLDLEQDSRYVNNPITLFHKALILSKQSQLDLAKVELDKALSIWKQADPEYYYYQKAA